jgi:hypothetical protein
MKQEKRKKQEKNKKEKVDKNKPSNAPPETGFIPLSQIPKDQRDVFSEIREKLEMAEAMQEMFDEDKVEHHHGSTQPEAD